MNGPINEVTIGDLTIIGHPDKVEFFMNRRPGVVKPVFFNRTPDIRLGLETIYQTESTHTRIVVNAPYFGTDVIRVHTFDLGENFEHGNEPAIAGYMAMLREIFGLNPQYTGGYANATYGAYQPGYGQPGYGQPGYGYTQPGWDDGRTGFNQFNQKSQSWE